MKSLAELQTKPGTGQGVGNPKNKTGGFNLCVCPKCGAEESHARGTPCNEMKCPNCDSPMQGK